MSALLLYLHVISSMALVGVIVTSAVVNGLAASRDGETAERLRGLAWRVALAAVAASILTVVFGEALRARDDVDGGWLDISSGIAYVALLLGSVVLAIVARLATDRPGLARRASWIALAMVAASLVTVFLMAAKPS